MFIKQKHLNFYLAHMIFLHIVFSLFIALNNAQDTIATPTNSATTTDSSTTTPQTSHTTTPPIYSQLGFIVGMGIMGGLILMVSLFMLITFCQREQKRRAKFAPKKSSTITSTITSTPEATNTTSASNTTKPTSDINNPQKGDTIIDINDNTKTGGDAGGGGGGDGGPF